MALLIQFENVETHRTNNLPTFPTREDERTSEIRWNMTETIAFADKYCLDQLSDEVMSLWIKYQAKDRLQLEELKKITSYITANTFNRCKARDFLAHLWAIEMLQAPGKGNGQPNGNDLEAFIDDNNFSKQVFYKMRCLAFQTSEKWQPVCDYHLHGKPGLCCDSTVLLYLCPFKAVDAETSAHNPEKKRKAT